MLFFPHWPLSVAFITVLLKSQIDPTLTLSPPRYLGHRFLERLGIMGMRESEVESPVFLHFLDCVWQLCRQFPSQFEFSEIYLTNIIDATHLGLFETFVFTSEHHRIRTLQV